MKFISDYINSLNYINKSLNLKEINSFLQALVKLKKNKGRLFILGVGISPPLETFYNIKILTLS